MTDSSEGVAGSAPHPRKDYAVVGGGHAAAAAVLELLRCAPSAQIILISDEDRLPYDRTVLSKVALGIDGHSPPALWPVSSTVDVSAVDVRLNTVVERIDVQRRSLVTNAGEVVYFGQLLIATGAVPRRISLPGIDGEDVYYLRDARDAEQLWKTLANPHRIAIIGGGVIGLEVASTARTMGHHVDIIEAASRVLQRSAPTAIAGYLADLHARNGVVIRTGVVPHEVLRRNGRVIGVRSADGEVIEVDVVIVGVGVRPQIELAQSAGLAIDDGIIVDASCRTSSDNVFAAGDVVRMQTKATDRGVRLESWQAAGRQAEVAARAMLGIEDSLYDDVPWTWSDQYDVSMQAVGLMNAMADDIVLTFPLEEAILVMTVAGERITSGCGVAPGDRIGRPIRALRKILETSARVDLDLIKASTSLKYLSGTLMDASRGWSHHGGR